MGQTFDLEREYEKWLTFQINEATKRAKKHPRLKKGFTHHSIDHNDFTFTYYLN